MEVYHLLLLCLAGALTTANESYDGYQLIQVTPTTERQVEVLKLLEKSDENDFWKGVFLNKPTNILVPPNGHGGALQGLLKGSGFAVHTSIPDVGKLIHEQDLKRNMEKDSRMFYESYHTLDEINQWVNDMVATYGNLVQSFVASSSYEGREILGLHITVTPDSPAFWFDGGIHSREWISPATVMFMAEQLLSNYGNDPQVTNLMDNMDFYVVPVVNVDGYNWTWTDDRLWRKTRSENVGSPCFGADPNRNWDVAWNTVGTTQAPCTDTYAGSEAFSEVEVRTIAQFVEDHPNMVAYFGYHSYGQMYMTPYGYKEDEAPDFQHLIDICTEATDAIRAVHNTDYVCDSLTNLVGPNSGSSVDYTYDILGITYSYGIELRDEGEYGFLLPEDQIIPTGEESYAGLLVFAENVLESTSPAQ